MLPIILSNEFAHHSIMANMYSPEGRTFLVTGGASGMGAQFVEEFVKKGAKRVAILDVQVDNGTKIAERINKTYPNKVVFVKYDVTDEKSVDEAFNCVLDEFKQLDVVINNAGRLADNAEDWRSASTLNWQGLTDLTLRGIQHMRKDEGGAGGTIINVSSIVALSRYNISPIYSGSKAAVLHFSQCISRGKFYEQTGVRLLTVCFGATDTPFVVEAEQRIWHQSVLKDLLETSLKLQRPESAVAAVLEMFNKGSNGSVWLSIDNKPAKDITQDINGAYAELERIVFS